MVFHSRDCGKWCRFCKKLQKQVGDKSNDRFTYVKSSVVFVVLLFLCCFCVVVFLLISMGGVELKLAIKICFYYLYPKTGLFFKNVS